MPPLKSIIKQVSTILGRPIPCIIGGDTTPILESILSTGTNSVICPSETNQKKFMEKMKLYPEVMVRININPGILVSGNLPAIYNEINKTMELAKGRKNVCIGTGIVPFETEPEVVLKVREYVQSL